MTAHVLLVNKAKKFKTLAINAYCICSLKLNFYFHCIRTFFRDAHVHKREKWSCYAKLINACMCTYLCLFGIFMPSCTFKPPLIDCKHGSTKVELWIYLSNQVIWVVTLEWSCLWQKAHSHYAIMCIGNQHQNNLFSSFSHWPQECALTFNAIT